MNQNRNPQQAGPEFSRGIAGSRKSVDTEGRHRSGEDETAFDERQGARRQDIAGEAGPKHRKQRGAPKPNVGAATPQSTSSAFDSPKTRRRGAEDEDRASGAPDEDEAMREADVDERDRIGRSPRES